MLYSALPLPEFTYEVPRYFHTGTWKRVYSISDVGEREKKGMSRGKGGEVCRGG